MTSQTKKYLQQVKERAEKATKLDRQVGTYTEKGVVSFFMFCEHTGTKIARIFAGGDREQELADASFHSNATTDIPKLLALIEKQDAVIEILRTGLTELRNTMKFGAFFGPDATNSVVKADKALAEAEKLMGAE